MPAKRLQALCAVLAMIAAASAKADTVNMTNTSVWGNDFTFLDLKVGSTTISNAATGAIAWNLNSVKFDSGPNIGQPDTALYNAITQGGVNPKVVTYCIEIGQDVIVLGNYTWTIGTLVGAPHPNGGGNPPSPLSGITPAQANALYTLTLKDNPENIAVSDKDHTAAMQLAIWEIVYDSSGPFSLSSGNFQASGASLTSNIMTNFNKYIADATTGTIYSYPGTPESGAFALLSDQNQDQMMAFPGGSGGPPTPLPPVAGMGAAMLGALALGKWQHRRLAKHAGNIEHLEN